MRLVTIIFLLLLFLPSIAIANPPKNNNERSKFYDFSEQVIDGQIRRPTVTFSNSRDKARFERLLRLKKSFLPNLFATSRERVFK